MDDITIKDEIEILEDYVVEFKNLIYEIDNSGIRIIPKDEAKYTIYIMLNKITNCEARIKTLKKQLKIELTLVQKILKFLRLI